MDEAPIHNPHDAFIKAGLGQPAQMAAFLKTYLPPSLTADIDWNSLEPYNTSFLDEHLHHRHADLLFSARFGTHPVFFHLLFEHQRTADAWMPLRLLTYQVRIWENHRRQNPDARLLPAILPIVFFQDRDTWKPSPRFRDLLDLPENIGSEWLACLPDFQHATINLAGLPLDPIADNLALRVMVQILRAILDPDPAQALATGLRTLTDLATAPDQATFLRICLTYLTRAGNTLDRKTIYTMIEAIPLRNLKEEAMTIAEQLIQEGRIEGRQEGRQEGRIEGERLILERQLTRKFGELDYPTLERIRQAPSSDLEVWGERILDATTLAEVFEG